MKATKKWQCLEWRMRQESPYAPGLPRNKLFYLSKNIIAMPSHDHTICGISSESERSAFK